MGAKQHARNQLRTMLLICVPWFMASLPGLIGYYVNDKPTDVMSMVTLLWPSIPAGLVLGAWLNLLLTTEPRAIRPAT